MNDHFDYIECGHSVILIGPDGQRQLLQNDDMLKFFSELNEIDEAWKDGNPNSDIFETIEDHIDLIIGGYFVGDEP